MFGNYHKLCNTEFKNRCKQSLLSSSMLALVYQNIHYHFQTETFLQTREACAHRLEIHNSNTQHKLELRRDFPPVQGAPLSFEHSKGYFAPALLAAEDAPLSFLHAQRRGPP